MYLFTFVTKVQKFKKSFAAAAEKQQRQHPSKTMSNKKVNPKNNHNNIYNNTNVIFPILKIKFYQNVSLTNNIS